MRMLCYKSRFSSPFLDKVMPSKFEVCQLFSARLTCLSFWFCHLIMYFPFWIFVIWCFTPWSQTSIMSFLLFTKKMQNVRNHTTICKTFLITVAGVDTRLTRTYQQPFPFQVLLIYIITGEDNNALSVNASIAKVYVNLYSVRTRTCHSN